jgi:hypothetical protein
MMMGESVNIIFYVRRLFTKLSNSVNIESTTTFQLRAEILWNPETFQLQHN